jgi:hypothetical protein
MLEVLFHSFSRADIRLTAELLGFLVRSACYQIALNAHRLFARVLPYNRSVGRWTGWLNCRQLHRQRERRP